MGRPYSMLDPNDRSPNAPSIIASGEQVLGLYNQETGMDMQKVTTKVQNWYIKRAKDYCWDEAKFSGNQCFLEVNLSRRDNSEPED